MMITGKLKCLLVLPKARQGAFMEANFEFSPNTTPPIHQKAGTAQFNVGCSRFFRLYLFTSFGVNERDFQAKPQSLGNLP